MWVHDTDFHANRFPDCSKAWKCLFMHTGDNHAWIWKFTLILTNVYLWQMFIYCRIFLHRRLVLTSCCQTYKMTNWVTDQTCRHIHTTFIHINDKQPESFDRLIILPCLYNMGTHGDTIIIGKIRKQTNIEIIWLAFSIGYPLFKLHNYTRDMRLIWFLLTSPFYLPYKLNRKT